MARTKKVADENKTLDFSDKKISDIYEAQIVLALKLDQLIALMEKVVLAAENNGTKTYM